VLISELTDSGAVARLSVPFNEGRVTGLAVSDDSNWVTVVVARSDQTVALEIWDRKGRRHSSALLPRQWARADAGFWATVKFGGPTATPLIAVVTDKGAGVWQFEPPRQLRLVVNHRWARRNGLPLQSDEVAVSPSGHTVAARMHVDGSQQTIQVWVDGHALPALPTEGIVGALVLPDDGALIAFISDPQRVVKRWNLRSVDTPPRQTMLAFLDPAGKDSLVNVPVAKIRFNMPVRSALSPKGTRLVIERLGTMELWDLEAPTQLFSKQGRDGTSHFVFDDEAGRLFTLPGQSVEAIDLAAGAVAEAACRVAGRSLTDAESNRYFDGRLAVTDCPRP
jgi:hypothetical protein